LVCQNESLASSRAELANDKLAHHKVIYDKHGEGRTNMAYRYVNRQG
jgi:cytochrome c-type biogenesis protein CcmH/NrfF